MELYQQLEKCFKEEYPNTYEQLGDMFDYEFQYFNSFFNTCNPRAFKDKPIFFIIELASTLNIKSKIPREIIIATLHFYIISLYIDMIVSNYNDNRTENEKKLKCYTGVLGPFIQGRISPCLTDGSITMDATMDFVGVPDDPNAFMNISTGALVDVRVSKYQKNIDASIQNTVERISDCNYTGLKKIIDGLGVKN